jgi:hypothetical protein
VFHNVPPVEALELRASSPALVLLFCSLKNHGNVGSTLPTRKFLIVDLIEHGDLLVLGGPIVFQILRSSLTMQLGGAIVGVS